MAEGITAYLHCNSLILRNITRFIFFNLQNCLQLFVNVNNSTGSVILSAAGGKESALEAIEVDGRIIENGAFTYSILEYINKNEEISINELKKYVERRVVEITNGRQKPTSRQESMEVDWMLLR